MQLRIRFLRHTGCLSRAQKAHVLVVVGLDGSAIERREHTVDRARWQRERQPQQACCDGQWGLHCAAPCPSARQTAVSSAGKSLRGGFIKKGCSLLLTSPAFPMPCLPHFSTPNTPAGSLLPARVGIHQAEPSHPLPHLTTFHGLRTQLSSGVTCCKMPYLSPSASARTSQ